MYLLLLEYEGECQWKFYSGWISDGQCELPWGGRNVAQTRAVRANRSAKTARDESKEEGDVPFLCFLCHWELLLLYCEEFCFARCFWATDNFSTFLFVWYLFILYYLYLFCYFDFLPIRTHGQICMHIFTTFIYLMFKFSNIYILFFVYSIFFYLFVFVFNCLFYA